MINGKQIIEIKYQTKIFDVEGLRSGKSIPSTN